MVALCMVSWCTMNPGVLGYHLREILAAEWREVIDQIWNSKITLVFTHFILTKS